MSYLVGNPEDRFSCDEAHIVSVRVELSLAIAIMFIGGKSGLPGLDSLALYEPPHNKTNEVTVHPLMTQISQGICPV